MNPVNTRDGVEEKKKLGMVTSLFMGRFGRIDFALGW